MKLKPGRYLRAENGHIYIYDALTAALPHMHVVMIGEDGAVEGDEAQADVTPTAPQPELRREDLEALYVAKYGRKPHPKMRIERLKQIVENGNGNDPGSDDH